MILGVYTCVYPYEAQNEDELSLAEDSVVYLLDGDDPDWWHVKFKSETETSGMVPSSYLEPVYFPSLRLSHLVRTHARNEGCL